MKIKFLILSFLPFSIVACQSTYKVSAPVVISAEKQSGANQTLSAYTWSYQPEGTSQPIQLNFSANRLSIKTGCNYQSSSWKVEKQQIITSFLVSTMQACEPSLMKNEQLTTSLFNEQRNHFELDTTSIEHPSLLITAANGQTYEFKGSITPEAKYQSQGEIIFLEISPATKPCTGIAPQTCLLVREIKYSDKGIKTQVNTGWTLFYDPIEGYQHHHDQRVIIRVKRYERKNPAADQSKYVYIHDLTVEQEILKP